LLPCIFNARSDKSAKIHGFDRKRLFGSVGMSGVVVFFQPPHFSLEAGPVSSPTNQSRDQLRGDADTDVLFPALSYQAPYDVPKATLAVD
jgi:hypothetical protein